MDLSIIIVNYNAKAFLDLCLQSVKAAIVQMDAEVFVVDNASSDGAPDMVRIKHDWVNLIVNKGNAGFSKANNQGIKAAKGKVIVIQNPDTIVAEDTYKKCLSFLEVNKKAGACGVRMLDGSGTFLPESKRGIPTPATSFFKAFGFAKLFPGSNVFSRYYLGHLSTLQNHQAEILAGAFICVKKEVLETTGLFDEDFFMFGEDIDLSYRFLKAGYENWYLADVPIIHFKGESSKKADEKYLNSFFGAMDIFYKKHFSNKGGSMFKWMVSMGICLKRNQFKRKANKGALKYSPPQNFFLVKTPNRTLPSYLDKSMNIQEVESFDKLTESPAGSGIIFTKTQSFKEMIDFMNAHPGKYSYFFQSGDDSFVLGSADKENSGVVWTHLGK